MQQCIDGFQIPLEFFVYQGTWWAPVQLAFYTVKLFFKSHFNVHAVYFIQMQSMSLVEGLSACLTPMENLKLWC